KHPEIKRVHVGFQTFQDDDRTAYKVGLWTPIYIELYGGTDGIKTRPGERPPYVEIEATDSEDVGTKINLVVDVDAEKDRTFTGYVKTGHMGQNYSELKVTLYANGQKYPTRDPSLSRSIDIDRHLYLALGSKMTDFNRAIKQMNRIPGVEEKDGVG